MYKVLYDSYLQCSVTSKIPQGATFLGRPVELIRSAILYANI